MGYGTGLLRPVRGVRGENLSEFKHLFGIYSKVAANRGRGFAVRRANPQVFS